MLKYILILLFVFSLNAEMTSRVKIVMGTFATASLNKEDKKYFNEIYNILKDIDSSLSTFNDKSPIFRLNRDKNTTINEYVYEALSLGEYYYMLTDGYFDIGIGSITKNLYSFGDKNRLPLVSELKSSNVSLSSLKFNHNSAQISENIKLDLGGMGKGFGVDKAIRYLYSKHIKKAIVALSGDIRCLGVCKIEINNPFSQEPLASFKTKKYEMGVSTSGNYNRFVKDSKHNHLINPKTKSSQNNFISVTLISELASSDLDAFATAVSVMPKSKAYEFLESIRVAYIIMERDKNIVISENILEYVENLLFDNTFKEQKKSIQ